MSADRGSVLTSNILVFGIAGFCVVCLRTSFRFYTRKISASDLFLVVALVSGALPPASLKEYSQGPAARILAVWADSNAIDLIARPGCFQCSL